MNNKISISQLKALIITVSFGFEALILPKLINSVADILIILLSGILLCTVVIKSKLNIMESPFLSFIYSVKNLLVAIFTVNILANAVDTVLFSNSIKNMIFLCIVLVSGYGAYKGVESVARVCQLLFWFVFLGTIYVYAMSFSDIDIKNIVWLPESKNFAHMILIGFLVNTAEVILLLKPYINENTNQIYKGIICSSLVIFFVLFVIMARFGLNTMKSVEYPFFEIMYTSNLPNIFIQRQEGIFISLWVISAFITIFIYFSTTVDYMKKLNVDKKFSAIFVTIIVGILSYFLKSSISIRSYCLLQIIAGAITVFIIPFYYMFKKRV